jgi:hypothetical protein
MPTLMIRTSSQRPRVPASDAHSIERSLHSAYARERIEELVHDVLEDALSPARLDAPPWRGDPAFEAEFERAVIDIAEVTTDLVAEHLSILLEAAPPRLAVRLAAAPRFRDLP